MVDEHQHIFLGCADGSIVQLLLQPFHVAVCHVTSCRERITLESMLPKAFPSGRRLTRFDSCYWFVLYNCCIEFVHSQSQCHMASHPTNAKYSDTVALTNDETNHKVTCVYSDPSLYLWDVTVIRKVCINLAGRFVIVDGNNDRRRDPSVWEQMTYE